MNRYDMLIELVTDKINSIEQMIRDGEYTDVHRWLHPILLRELSFDYSSWTDAELQEHYNAQMGVDTPSSPPLSSGDAQEKDDQIYSQAEEGERRSMRGPSGLDGCPLSLLHSLRNATGLGEVAAESPELATSQASVYWY